MIDIMDLINKLLLFIDKNLVIVVIGLLVYYLIISLSIYNIYKKVGLKEKKALIPVYNIISILDFVSLPSFLIILFVVPYVNILGIIIGGFVVNSRIGRVLQKGTFTRLMLGIFPIIFLPLLSMNKNLTYEKIDTNDVEEEEEQDDTLDIPTYKVEVKEVDNLAALSVDDLFNTNSQLNKPIKVDEFASGEEGVEELTFDYNQLYSNDTKTGIEPVSVQPKDEVSSESNIEEFTFDNVESQNETTTGDVIEGVNVEPEMTNIEENQVNIPIVESPVGDQPEPIVENVVPVEPVIAETPVVEAPVDVQPEPVNETPSYNGSDYTFDYNSLYGTNAPSEEQVEATSLVETPVEPVIEEPVIEQNVEPEISVIDAPVEVQPEVVEQPVLEDVVVDAVEDMYANVPAPVEVTTEEVIETPNDVQSESIVEEAVPVEPVVAEPPVTETPVEVQPEVVEQPVLEDVVVDAVEDIYANVPAPVEETVQEVKILKDDDTDELLKQSKDGMTLDYNSLYNIEADTTYEEEQKKKEAEEKLEKEAEENGMLAIDPYSAISVAEAPSFDFVEEPEVVEEPVIEEVAEPVQEENLVSMEIEEPGLLPVGKVTGGAAIRLDKKKKNKYDEATIEENSNHAPVASMGLNDLLMTPGAKKNPSQAPGPVQQGRPMNGPRPQGRPMNGPRPQGRPMNGPRPQGRPMNGPVMRPQPGQGNYGPRPKNSKFISNDRDNYTLPPEEPAYVQQPTDPNLRANPLSIFGSGAKSGLRPTADEAIRRKRRPANNAQNNNGLCPFCGFAVKPGQPRCVMCGRRLM